MRPKPGHLSPENAARFKHQSVVDRYHLRLPYPPETFSSLAGLFVGAPRTVLDIGTGTGEIARNMVDVAEWIDAVDCSEPMIMRGRSLPGGDHPRLNWIVSRIEDMELHPPYALITGGDSIHWMDWEIVFPRFAQMLTPNGVVAIVHRSELPAPWQEQLMALIRRYSTMRNYQPFDLVAELEVRGLFRKLGASTTPPITYKQSVHDYIASFHSRSSLSLEAMPAADAEAFDGQFRELVLPWSEENVLELHTEASIVWGTPIG